jgi:hypothetical protein
LSRTIAVSLENRPGAFAEVADLFGQAGVDILGFSTQALGDFGQVIVFVDKFDAAVKALDRANLRYRTREVLLTEVDDRPGSLANLARTLAKAGVNIELAFNAVGVAAGRAAVVLEVSDVKAGRAALEATGYPIFDSLARAASPAGGTRRT